MRLLSQLALVLSLGACSPDRAPSIDDLPVDVFTNEDAAAWGFASFKWARVVALEKHTACDLPRCTVGGVVWRIAKWPRVPGWTGSTDPGTRIIDVGHGLPPDVYRRTAVHELGHALGLDHTPDGVMAPEGPSDEFTPAVLEMCRRARSCP